MPVSDRPPRDGTPCQEEDTLKDEKHCFILSERLLNPMIRALTAFSEQMYVSDTDYLSFFTEENHLC